MTKMKKSPIVSLLLVIVLVLTMLPTEAFAEELPDMCICEEECTCDTEENDIPTFSPEETAESALTDDITETDGIMLLAEGFCSHPHLVGVEWYRCTTVLECTACGRQFTQTNHSYGSYGPWQYYNETQHQSVRRCSSCGSSSSRSAAHSLSTRYEEYSTTQHAVRNYCSVCASFVGAEAYEDHIDSDENNYCDACGALMSLFSVTVPDSLSLTVSQTGQVYAAATAQIVNDSTGAVQVSDVILTAENGWTIVPYSTNMADAKVNSKLIGFHLNGAESAGGGSSEILTLGSGWTIPKEGVLPLDYGAVVSAVSQPVSEQVLTVVFVIGWAA